MRVLLTGATGYIGKRLLPLLLERGHTVVCAVRDARRFALPPLHHERVEVVEADFLDRASLPNIPVAIDAAFYLIHSMAGPDAGFEALEAESAGNFSERISETQAKQVIYLGGIINADQLSPHLASRHKVEQILGQGRYALTTLRAGIIIGSGSASFEIMRDLVEKLPVMITPRWLDTRSQPIAVRDVLSFLIGVLGHEPAYRQAYDIGGPEVLTYKEMLLRFAKARGLHRVIMTVPVMTPRLSSYWLYFVTATSYPLAVHLVNSMKVEVVCRPNELARELGVPATPFDAAIARAFAKIEQNEIVSSWKDALRRGTLDRPLAHYVEIPRFGCFRDVRRMRADDVHAALSRIWSIGGARGWYHANWLWRLRGLLDKVAGGVGLRRGRTHPTDLHPGDALDFWRVLLADREGQRLLLYAEMKLPGDAWLELRIDPQGVVHQEATFRPRGLLGRLYWYAVLPLHAFVFGGMLRKLAQGS
jgi:uncharacterized protein YbjT (DUF2867 family)